MKIALSSCKNRKEIKLKERHKTNILIKAILRMACKFNQCNPTLHRCSGPSKNTFLYITMAFTCEPCLCTEVFLLK